MNCHFQVIECIGQPFFSQLQRYIHIQLILWNFERLTIDGVVDWHYSVGIIDLKQAKIVRFFEKKKDEEENLARKSIKINVQFSLHQLFHFDLNI